jgi:hypothetical protein
VEEDILNGSAPWIKILSKINKKDPAQNAAELRSMMLGYLESLHSTLKYFTYGKDKKVGTFWDYIHNNEKSRLMGVNYVLREMRNKYTTADYHIIYAAMLEPLMTVHSLYGGAN